MSNASANTLLDDLLEAADVASERHRIAILAVTDLARTVGDRKRQKALHGRAVRARNSHYCNAAAMLPGFPGQRTDALARLIVKYQEGAWKRHAHCTSEPPAEIIGKIEEHIWRSLKTGARAITSSRHLDNILSQGKK